MKRIPIKVISTQESNLLQVRFFPTDICNYNCSYCFPGSHDAKYRYPKDVELIVKNFKILFDYYKTLGKEKFHLVIAGGGEPTLWPHLEQFCQELKRIYNVYITIITNGSRTLSWWDNNSKYFDDVVLSCHHEFVDIDHFVSVGDLLFESGIKVTALALMDAEYWDKCTLNVDQMLNSKYPWYIQTKVIVGVPEKGADVYSQEQYNYANDSLKRMPNSDWLLKRLDEIKLYESVVIFNDDTAVTARPHTILINQWNNFKGWSCKIGMESVAIDASGRLRVSCGLNMFSEDLNIFSNNFQISELPNMIVCTKDLCNCQPDTHATKCII